MIVSKRGFVLWAALAAASMLIVVLARRQIDLSRAYAELRTKASLPFRGYAMPTFRTATLAGDSITVGESADTASRELVFVFTTTCQFCKATIPIWIGLADSSHRLGRPIRILALSLDSAGTTARYVAEHSLTYPVATFPHWKIAQLFRARAVPQTLVLDHDGQVIYGHTGRLQPGTALDSVYAALRGEFGAFDPRPPASRPVAGTSPATATARR